MLGTPKGQGTGPCGRLLRKRKVTILGMQQWAISRKPKESPSLVGSSETIRGASVEISSGLGIARLGPSQILIWKIQSKPYETSAPTAPGEDIVQSSSIEYRLF
jgi:hypothetical protein